MRVDYRTYIRSSEWYARRQMILDMALHRCMLCDSSKDLQVHHRTYARLGKEHPADLIALCDNCHARFHDKLPVPVRLAERQFSDDVEFPTAEEARALRNWCWEQSRRSLRPTADDEREAA